MEYIQLLMLLLFGHFLADYPLQGDFLSRAKNHTNPIPGVPWYQAMIAHCGIHAGFVYIITGIPGLALVEFIAHFIIDYKKCAGRFGFDEDQILHVFYKIMYVAVIFVFSIQGVN